MNQVIDASLIKLLSGKYQIESQIGHGAQGNIYLGRCLSDGTQVAIKQLRVNSTKNWKQYELFSREADILSKLHVKGTAKFYEAIQALDTKHPMSVIVQEYIDGRSLQTYLNSGHRFEFGITCQILLQLLDILENLHHHDPIVIHRDLKPSNILLRYNDDAYSIVPEVFVIDFGAVANPQVQDGGSTVTGTYGYMPPEQLVGKPVPASDIYSFAVIAVYLLSGVPPENIAVQDLQLLIDPHLEHLPHPVTAFLRMMLDKNPTTRLIDYDQIRKTLEMFQNHVFKLPYINSTSKKDSEYTIIDVNAIAQPGNIGIWYDLPDETPRKVPPEYIDMFYCANEELRNGASITYNRDANTQGILNFAVADDSYLVRTGHVNLMHRKFGKEFHNRHIAYLGCAITMILASLSLVGIAFCQMISIPSSSNNIMKFMGLPLVFYLFLFCASLTAMVICIKLYQLWRKDYTQQFQTFFEHARKSLAQIEDIRLISAADAFHRAFHLPAMANASSDITTDRSKQLNKSIRPIWEIKYSFNPPDDNNPAPITHIYYSDVFIDRNKIGETLSILYYIKDNIVYSMPYPLPLSSSILQCPYMVAMFGITVKTDASEAIYH